MRLSLIINPKYEQIIPPLTSDEFAQLEENILAEGRIINPIITWKDVIVDGHNRYKIALKHTHIPFTTISKEFACDDEVVIWICNNQLGRRNITDSHREYLVGKRYDAEKNMHGGDRKSATTKSSGQNDHLISHKKTREKIAEETGLTDTGVRRADEFARGVDIADEICPGTKDKILSEELTPRKKDIRSISKLPKAERAEAVAKLYYPKGITPTTEDTKKNSINKSTSKTSDNGLEAELSPSIKKASEENILGSMQGSVDLFISTYNNYFIQFPKLRTESEYRKKAVEILKNLKKYIEKIEGELK